MGHNNMFGRLPIFIFRFKTIDLIKVITEGQNTAQALDKIDKW